MSREDWLLMAIECLKSGLFKQHGASIPHLRVSVGFPGGGSAHKRIGEYWPSKAISDGIPQIFISPILDKPVECLDVLVHELVHACTPGAGHGKLFKRLALKVGLTGKMRSTVAGPELKSYLEKLSTDLGLFPQSKINLSSRKKQSTRLGKVSCQSCGYVCRVTKKWLDELGTPICPCNNEPMNIEE